MATKKSIFATVFFLIGINSYLFSQTIQYTFPDESEPHEGTWLQWPHQYEYGVAFRNENDATWVAMTKALVANEKVHIIAYNTTEQTRISNLLTAANVSLLNVNFKIFQTNDVWVRDNGPIYVRNTAGNLVLQDWGFNGWGGDYNFAKCNPIPTSIATATGITVVNLNNILTIEGGSYEMDGAGTFLATKTSILSQVNPTSPTGIKSIRNLGKTQAQVEAILRQNLGAIKFIWLDGWFSQDDITDAHIDGFAKFVGNKLVTMSQADLLYWGASQSDIDKLFAATNVNNVAYAKVILPLTANDVKKTNGTSLGYKGSYANYYVANNRVLVPNYNDPNDSVANAIIAGLYPGRTVVGIDCRNLYGNGGMVHCVTQQQPMTSNVVDTQAPTIPANLTASGTTATTTNLIWTASTDNVGVTGYDVYQGVILKATVFTTSYSVTGLTASTAYSFTVKAKDAAGNSSIASNTVNISTIVATTATYCPSKGTDASGETIKSVVFASINKSSTATIGYENFTTTSTNVNKGSSYSITITPHWFYGTYAEGYAVFIDYNKDGDFTDSGETVWTKTPSTLASVTGNITIPATAAIGITRMRIAMKYNGIPTSCETFAYGQVEDYTLNITSNVLRTSLEKVESKISIFPNPANSEIEVDGVLDNSTIEIYNSTGQLVRRIDLYLKENKIQIEDLVNGMYFIKCFESDTSSANSKTIKFIKQ